MADEKDREKLLTSGIFRARFFSVDNSGALREELEGTPSGRTKEPSIITGGEVARLVTDTGMVCLLTGSLVLGRSSFQGVLPDHKTNQVSRRHCRIWKESRKYLIEDGVGGQRSTNGTRVDKTEIRGAGPVELRNGSVIELGGMVWLRFEVVKPASPERAKKTDVRASATPRGDDGVLTEGSCYLLESVGGAVQYSILRRLVSGGSPACMVSTMHPSALEQMHQLELAESFWISDATDPVAVKPSRLDFELAKGLKLFLGSNRSAILFFEGIEYVSSEIGFDKTVRFVKRMVDWVSSARGTLLVVVDPRSLTEAQTAVLEHLFHRILKA
jgi:hypothetical protein